jgi:predicted nucleic acid-binding protein
VRDLISLALDRIDTVPLLPDILHLATERDISVYDATYVFTAQFLGIPLLTADERLRRKMNRMESAARMLSPTVRLYR